jgi:methyl-accepting chemotaxis protein
LNSPTDRLGKLLQEVNDAPASDYPRLQLKVPIQSAIEIGAALNSLREVLNEIASRAVTIADNLQSTIEKATEQSEMTAQQSTHAAKESAKLSQQLNRLTLWIIGAAILSAIAACIQAGAAIYSVLHTPQ